jgi:hypothetical protein
MRNQIANFQNSAAQVFRAIAPALMTAALFRLGVGLAAMVLFSLMGGFIAPELPAAMSVAGLVYAFAPPISDFRIDNPQHIGVMVGVLLFSLIATRLIRSAQEAVVSGLITFGVTRENNDQT